MNQAPGDWGMRFNSGPQGMPQRFGMQMGGAGMNMMNRNMNPRFGMNMMNQNMNMMNQQRMNMMNQQNMMMNQQNMNMMNQQNMNMMNQQRMNMMNQQRMNMMNQQRMNMTNQQNQGMGNFGVGPGMGFGGQITDMDNTDNDQGPGFDEQDKDMEDDGATPAKVAKKDTNSTDEKTETVSKIEKKDTKSDAKSAGDTKMGKKAKKRTEDPKPDIEKLRKYHIPKRDSSRDEDPTNETEEPTSILDQAFDNKPKTYNYNKRLNETISTKGPRPLMNISKDKEQNSYNTRKSGPNATDVNRKEPMSLMSLSFDPSKQSGPNATDVNRKEPMSLMSLSFDPSNLGHGENVKDLGNNSKMFGRNIAAENFKVPMPLAAYISNTGQHGGRHLDQPIEGMGNTGPLAFVQSKDSLKSVPMKKNLSFVDSEQDQDSDAEVQQEDSSEGDDDWDDEGVPQPAFNPTPMNLITDTGMPRQMSSAKLLSGDFVRGRTLVKQDIDPLGRGTGWSVHQPNLLFSVEKNNRPALLNIDSYPPIDPNNIGSIMLCQMGWTPGTGLGVMRSGIMNPVTASGRLGGRHGLGGLPGKERKMMKMDNKKDKAAPFKSLKTQEGKDNIIKYVQELLKHLKNGTKTPVVVLTEYVTRRKRQAEFKLPVGLEESANDVSFARQCVVGGKYYETGTGPNKKDAKSAAAWNAFRALVREMYQEIGMTVPLEIEKQLNTAPGTEKQRNKPSRWSMPGIQAKREDLLTRQPDPIDKKKITLTPALEDVVKKFYEGMKHTINALTECCQQQSIKLEFRDVEGTEQQPCGCRIFLDDVEYGYAVSKGKKSAKSDAALIAFVAFVKDIYNNSDQALPNSFTSLCRLGLSRLEQLESAAKAKAKAESLVRLQQMQPKRSILKATARQPTSYNAASMEYNQAQFQGPMGFQAPNQGLQGPQVPKKGILKQNSNQGPQFNQGQQNQAPNQNLQNKALNQRMQNIASNQGLQNMAPKQNQGSNQNLQNKALNQRMQNLASNQGLQNMAPNQNQAPNHGLQNMAPNQRMQMSQNQASMSWNQTPNPRQLSNQGYQDQGPMSWNQIGNSRQMGSQNKNFMNQGLQRTQNFESGNDQMDTTTSDSKGWLEVPPPDIYKPKFSKFPDKPADKKGKDSNAMSFYEAERLISAKLEKDWEMGKAGIGAETPQETVSKLFGSQTESDSRPEKKPITKMKFEKPTTKVNYSELVQKAHKTFGKKSITDSGNEKKENKSAPWDWKKPASKPAAKWTETSQNKKDSWSRQPKKPQQPMKKSVSESSLDTCQAHQGLGSILQRLATDGDIETDDGSEETESEMPQNPLGLGSLIKKLSDAGEIETDDSQRVNPGMRRPASMTSLDRRGNQGTLRSRLAGIAGGYGDNFEEEEYREADYMRGGGFPPGPMTPQNRFNQPRANNPFMGREQGFLSQNLGRLGTNRPMMGMGMAPRMGMTPPKPFMAVRPMMSQGFGQQMGMPKSLLDLPFEEPSGDDTDESGLKPPSYKLVQHFYDGSKKPLAILKEYCKQNNVKPNFKAGSFEKWQQTGIFERRCEINGTVFDKGEASTKAEAEEDAALMAFRAILRDFNLDQGMERHGNMLIDLKEKVMAEMGVKRDSLIFIMRNPVFVFLTG